MTRQERLHNTSWPPRQTCPQCLQRVADCEGHTLADQLARLGWTCLLAVALMLAVWLGCAALGLAETLAG